MSFSSSRGWITGTSMRAVSPLGLASTDWVSRVPAPAASSAYALTTSIPLVENRVSAPLGGSYAVISSSTSIVRPLTSSTCRTREPVPSAPS